MIRQIYVTGSGLVGPTGTGANAWEQPGHGLQTDAATGLTVGRLPQSLEAELTALQASRKHLRRADRSALLALLAARQAIEEACWTAPDLARCPLNLGSSRGPTQRLERAHTAFLTEGRVLPHTSPTTTLAAAANLIAAELGLGGMAIGHSLTCSSSAFALANAWVWMSSGRVDTFLAGGTEAPLTAFTLAQMQALGLTSTLHPPDNDWPCRPFAAHDRNTFVLSEGAAFFALEAATEPPAQAQALLSAFGWGTERGASPTAIDPAGAALQQAIGEALQQARLSSGDIDAILAHAPGTMQGDAAERQALQAFWGNELPPLASVKAKVGHALGASAAMGLHAAVHLVSGGRYVAPDYADAPRWPASFQPKRVLVLATGFGGSACAWVVERVRVV